MAAASESLIYPIFVTLLLFSGATLTDSYSPTIISDEEPTALDQEIAFQSGKRSELVNPCTSDATTTARREMGFNGSPNDLAYVDDDNEIEIIRFLRKEESLSLSLSYDTQAPSESLRSLKPTLSMSSIIPTIPKIYRSKVPTNSPTQTTVNPTDSPSITTSAATESTDVPSTTTGFPTGPPTYLPTKIHKGTPSDIPTQLPSGISYSPIDSVEESSGFPTELPSNRPTQTTVETSQPPSSFPTESAEEPSGFPTVSLSNQPTQTTVATSEFLTHSPSSSSSSYIPTTELPTVLNAVASTNPTFLRHSSTSRPSESFAANTESSISYVPWACMDNRNFFLKRKRFLTCKFIGATNDRRKKYCSRKEVQTNCPLTCGRCCSDDPDFVMGDISRPRSCEWIAQSDDIRNLCPHQLRLFYEEVPFQVQDFCPKTCDMCREPITLPPSPSSSPLPFPFIIYNG